jgi:hypothetical protein
MFCVHTSLIFHVDEVLGTFNICVCIYVCLFIFIFLHAHIHGKHVSMYIHTYSHTFIHIDIFSRMYIIYIHIYIYTYFYWLRHACMPVQHANMVRLFVYLLIIVREPPGDRTRVCGIKDKIVPTGLAWPVSSLPKGLIRCLEDCGSRLVDMRMESWDTFLCISKCMLQIQTHTYMLIYIYISYIYIFTHTDTKCIMSNSSLSYTGANNAKGQHREKQYEAPYSRAETSAFLIEVSSTLHLCSFAYVCVCMQACVHVHECRYEVLCVHQICTCMSA